MLEKPEVLFSVDDKSKYRELYGDEFLRERDFINSSELREPREITTLIIGMKVGSIRPFFDQKTFKGFFRKI